MSVFAQSMHFALGLCTVCCFPQMTFCETTHTPADMQLTVCTGLGTSFGSSEMLHVASFSLHIQCEANLQKTIDTDNLATRDKIFAFEAHLSLATSSSDCSRLFNKPDTRRGEHDRKQTERQCGIMANSGVDSGNRWFCHHPLPAPSTTGGESANTHRQRVRSGGARVVA